MSQDPDTWPDNLMGIYQEQMDICDRLRPIEKPNKEQMIDFLVARKIITEIREIWKEETAH
jgi:hypothetical protein